MDVQRKPVTGTRGTSGLRAKLSFRDVQHKPVTGTRGTSGLYAVIEFNGCVTPHQARSQRPGDASPSLVREAPQGCVHELSLRDVQRSPSLVREAPQGCVLSLSLMDVQRLTRPVASGQVMQARHWYARHLRAVCMN